MGAKRAAVALVAVGLLAGCGAPPGARVSGPAPTGPVPSETGCTALLCTQPVPSTGGTAPTGPTASLPPGYSGLPSNPYPVAPTSAATTCPPGAPTGSAILAAARRVSHGKLPADTVVGTPHCSGDYLVADLTAPSLGTIRAVLHRTNSGWRAVAVGSYPCKAVTAAPTAARALLGCY